VGTSADFVNPDTGDFHLRAGGVPRGAGNASFAPRSDFAGQCYAKPPSLGALELTPDFSGPATTR
jgi:hypothetical protein